jgi:surface antigen
MRLRRSFAVLGISLLAVATSRPSLAANICNEAVPSNHMVDGLPAYAQCDASRSSAIYSNNGTDTATASGGTDWVRTQGSGGYQCTEWAHRYLRFKWNVANVPNGNAGTWCDSTTPAGLVKTTTPVHGDVIVFAPGSCGADTTTGHVAVVDVVGSNATVTFVEQNGANRRSCAISTAACFLHATANDGTAIDGGAVDSGVPDASVPAGPETGSRREVAGDRGTDVIGSGGATGTGGATGVGGASGTGGVVASGGRVGTGGAAGAGGQAGSGGSIGAGGALASGGAGESGGAGGAGGTTTAASTGGSGGTSSPGSTEPEVASSSGCACHLTAGGAAGRQAQGWAVLLGLCVAVGLLASRRRRR